MMIISPNVVKRNMFSWYSLMGISHLIMDGTNEHVDLSSNNWGKKGYTLYLGMQMGMEMGLRLVGSRFTTVYGTYVNS